jgi:hypothetical protein
MGLRARAWSRNLIYVVDETAGAQRPVPSVHDAIRNDDEDSRCASSCEFAQGFDCATRALRAHVGCSPHLIACLSHSLDMLMRQASRGSG